MRLLTPIGGQIMPDNATGIQNDGCVPIEFLFVGQGWEGLALVRSSIDIFLVLPL